MATIERGHGVMHEYYGSRPYHRYVVSMYVNIHIYFHFLLTSTLNMEAATCLFEDSARIPQYFQH